MKKSDFMKVAARVVKDVAINDYTVQIKSLSAKVVMDAQKYYTDKNYDMFSFTLVANSVLDDDGNLMIGSKPEYDELNYATIDKLILEIMDLNNLAPEQIKKVREAARESLKNDFLEDSVSN